MTATPFTICDFVFVWYFILACTRQTIYQEAGLNLCKIKPRFAGIFTSIGGEANICNLVFAYFAVAVERLHGVWFFLLAG